MPSITLAPSIPAGATVVAVPVFKGLESPSSLVDLEHLRARGWEANVGDTAILPGADGTTVIAVGVGARDGVDAHVLRKASGALVKAASKLGDVTSLLLDALPEGADRSAGAQAAAEGAGLGSYRFTRFKSETNGAGPGVGAVTLVGKGGKKAADAAARGSAIAEAVAIAQDLINTPPGDLSPKVLADHAVAIAERTGLGVEVVDEKAAKKLGMGGLAGVGQGSDNPPRLVKLTYLPEKARGNLALVGKGITFDSGGLSLKPPDGMMTMKCDMSGAAAVLAAMSVLPAVGARTAVRGYLCAAENMPSGKAIRPGDVLKISNGKTVEVLNTDAEGRLVLADGLVTAVAEGADAIVDVATLTGACVVALGSKIAGLMGNSDEWIEQVQAAADRAGEPVWHLPLPTDYRKMLDSDVADIKNVSGGRDGGALTAGLFLQEFVDGVPWAHLDIAGPAFLGEAGPLHPKGATGFAVRTLVELATTFTRPRRTT